MINKDSLRKVHHATHLILSITIVGIAIYYFFISKNIFNDMQLLILWGLVGAMHLEIIINSKFLENNFSWKHNKSNILYILISIFFIIGEITRLWL